MLDLVLIAMFQAVAGDPAAAPAEPAAPVAAQEEIAPEEVVVCRMVRATGSRVPTRRCTSQNTDDENRLHSVELARQLSAGGRSWNPNPDGGGASGFLQGGTGKR